MQLKLTVYDPPMAGWPHLAVVLDADAVGPAEVVLVESFATLHEAEAALIRISGQLEKAGREGA